MQSGPSHPFEHVQTPGAEHEPPFEHADEQIAKTQEHKYYLESSFN